MGRYLLLVAEAYLVEAPISKVYLVAGQGSKAKLNLRSNVKEAKRGNGSREIPLSGAPQRRVGSKDPNFSEEFSRIMTKRFEMSMMGELKFFLGLQVKQLKDDTFISQTKYLKDVLKKFDMDGAKPIKTPMLINGHLDINGKKVDVKSGQGLGLAENPDWTIRPQPGLSGSCQVLGPCIPLALSYTQIFIPSLIPCLCKIIMTRGSSNVPEKTRKKRQDPVSTSTESDGDNSPSVQYPRGRIGQKKIDEVSPSRRRGKRTANRGCPSGGIRIEEPSSCPRPIGSARQPCDAQRPNHEVAVGAICLFTKLVLTAAIGHETPKKTVDYLKNMARARTDRGRAPEQ
uniref:Reverse transcriptase Ty1/copia-type domain-containing protein n=1 Tax=Oryza brachyantha TaxID=4533 RepID=J3NCQ5_ORYBR